MESLPPEIQTAILSPRFHQFIVIDPSGESGKQLLVEFLADAQLDIFPGAVPLPHFPFLHCPLSWTLSASAEKAILYIRLSDSVREFPFPGASLPLPG